MATGAVQEFQFTQGEQFQVTGDLLTAWKKDGAIIIKNLIPDDELQLLWKNLLCDSIKKATYEIDDGTGVTKSRLVIWNKPGDDVSGLIVRSEKLVRTCEQIFGGEVFHYSSKLIQKEPRTGGAFQWHQDYGYWYKSGNMTPDMCTVFVALDPCDTENGCLEIMPGTHRCGRIDHVMVGGQQGADPERVHLLQSRFPVVPVELERGDAIIFHSNIVHKSNANHSNRRRWAMLYTYNMRENESPIPHHCPGYMPIDVVADEKIAQCTNFDDFANKEFMNAQQDKTVGDVSYVAENVQKE